MVMRGRRSSSVRNGPTKILDLEFSSTRASSSKQQQKHSGIYDTSESTLYKFMDAFTSQTNELIIDERVEWERAFNEVELTVPVETLLSSQHCKWTNLRALFDQNLFLWANESTLVATGERRREIQLKLLEELNPHHTFTFEVQERSTDDTFVLESLEYKK